MKKIIFFIAVSLFLSCGVKGPPTPSYYPPNELEGELKEAPKGKDKKDETQAESKEKKKK